MSTYMFYSDIALSDVISLYNRKVLQQLENTERAKLGTVYVFRHAKNKKCTISNFALNKFSYF